MDIYNIGYITIKKIDNCENINSVSTIYVLPMQTDILKKKV